MRENSVPQSMYLEVGENGEFLTLIIKHDGSDIS